MKNFCLIFISIIVLACCPVNPKDELFIEAARNDSLGNYDKSIELYTRIIELDSTEYGALINRGRARINKNDLGGIVDLERAANDFPNDETYLNLASSYMYLNVEKDMSYDKDFIMLKLNKAEAFNPDNYKIYLVYAGFYSMLQNSSDSVVKYANKVIRMQNKYSSTYHFLENAYLQQCNYKNVIIVCDTILKYEPNYAYSHNNRGFAKLNLGDINGALQDLNNSIKIDPQNSHAYNNRGFAKFKLGDIKGALQDINKSLELDNLNSYAYKNLAIIALFENDKDKACSNLKMAQQLGYSEKYGNEVDSLVMIYCKK